MNPFAPTRHSQVRRWFATCLFTLVLLLPALAMAQVPGISAADRADIQNFTLNEDVVGRLKGVMTEGRAMHIKKSHLDMAKVHSLDDMADQIVSADPRIKPLLAKHGFTPRQFLVANLALVGTVMTVRYAEKSGKEKALESQLNPANVSFYKKHKAAMDALVNPPAPAASSMK
ncbi:MAG TPA: hypothetical protein VFL78_04960 [Rhodanobacteraceae bacterium]|nr:hypothetical protein [Rhodanobacteraceae bacterium]